ncbi:MAG: hypothetical protein ABSD13_20825 [Candidatus Korobacteraceae bacterium]|jgi:hypothetical protein
MWGIKTFLGISMMLFAAFSASNTYMLNSYSIGPGGTNSATSNTYKAQSNAGEISGTANSTTYTVHSGAVQTEQLNVPLAPTLSNGSGTYYNELQFTINVGILPTDTTYAIAVSNNGFTTTNYVQATGVLGGSPVYQTYTAWGGSSGSYMTGLSNSSTYEVKVAALEGLFTNTEYGPYATATTTTPSISLSISPTSSNLGSLTAGTVITSSTNITASLTTDAESGANVFVFGQYGGLHSPSKSYTIAGVSGNLASLTEGFGLQGVSATQSSGGPLSLVSPYNGTANNVGIDSNAPHQILTTSQEVQSGSSVIELQAKSANIDPAANDYQELLTFSAAAQF